MGKKTTRKMRGKKTFGYGSKKKHRGSGSRGGRGMAGSFGHKKLMILKNNPEHFGKRGFKIRNLVKPKAIGLRDLEKLAEKTGNKKLKLEEFGYGKVIGTGNLSGPLEVEAIKFSAGAREKIEKAGGKCIETKVEDDSRKD